jgi:hypothetical protein
MPPRPYEDIGARIRGDISSVQQQKDAFRKYIAGGGDPYATNRPDRPGWM